jgi:hypothetical protein
VARTRAEPHNAVDVPLARETNELRQTELTLQGQIGFNIALSRRCTHAERQV